MPLIEAKSLKKQVLISCNNKKLQNIPAVHLQSYFGVGCSGGMGKANFIKWIKADFREWSKAHRRLVHIALLQYAAGNLNYGIKICW